MDVTTRLLNNSVGLKESRGFNLSQLDFFPYYQYLQRRDQYADHMSWFTGEALKEEIGEGIEKYPIRINPIANACLKHGYALWGEYPDDIEGPLARPRARTKDGKTNDRTKFVEDLLNQIYTENNATSMMIDASVAQQIAGGGALRIAWAPDDEDLEYKIRLEWIEESDFFCVPYHDNPWKLRHAWIIRSITREDALEYGVLLDTQFGYYVEHWDELEYQVQINEIPIPTPLTDNAYPTYENTFGFVPFIYIPRVRASKKFWGDSLITNATKGLCREINTRMADAGDAVSDDTHQIGIMRNVRGVPKLVQAARSTYLLDIGHSSSIASGSENSPEVTFPAQRKFADPVLKLVDDLYKHFRREVNVPAVADGEDEGSQRSSATLITRMWPLAGQVRVSRSYWSVALRVAAQMILKILSTKEQFSGVTKDDLKLRIRHRWYPILSRDREQLVNELAVRAAAKIGSLEHLMTLAGDIENVEDEMERLMAWEKFIANIAPAFAKPFGNDPQKGDSSSKKESANSKKEDKNERSDK